MHIIKLSSQCLKRCASESEIAPWSFSSLAITIYDEWVSADCRSLQESHHPVSGVVGGTIRVHPQEQMLVIDKDCVDLLVNIVHHKAL